MVWLADWSSLGCFHPAARWCTGHGPPIYCTAQDNSITDDRLHGIPHAMVVVRNKGGMAAEYHEKKVSVRTISNGTDS